MCIEVRSTAPSQSTSACIRRVAEVSYRIYPKSTDKPFSGKVTDSVAHISHLLSKRYGALVSMLPGLLLNAHAGKGNGCGTCTAVCPSYMPHLQAVRVVHVLGVCPRASAPHNLDAVVEEHHEHVRVHLAVQERDGGVVRRTRE